MLVASPPTPPHPSALRPNPNTPASQASYLNTTTTTAPTTSHSSSSSTSSGSPQQPEILPHLIKRSASLSPPLIQNTTSTFNVHLNNSEDSASTWSSQFSTSVSTAATARKRCSTSLSPDSTKLLLHHSNNIGSRSPPTSATSATTALSVAAAVNAVASPAAAPFIDVGVVNSLLLLKQQQLLKQQLQHHSSHHHQVSPPLSSTISGTIPPIAALSSSSNHISSGGGLGGTAGGGGTTPTQQQLHEYQLQQQQMLHAAYHRQVKQQQQQQQQHFSHYFSNSKSSGDLLSSNNSSSAVGAVINSNTAVGAAVNAAASINITDSINNNNNNNSNTTSPYPSFTNNLNPTPTSMSDPPYPPTPTPTVSTASTNSTSTTPTITNNNTNNSTPPLTTPPSSTSSSGAASGGANLAAHHPLLGYVPHGANKILSRNLNGTLAVTTQPSNESELQLYRVLQRANLLTYYDVFISQGGDDVQQLCEAGEEEFLEIMALVGMASKPLHVRRLQKALQEWVTNPREFIPSPPSSVMGVTNCGRYGFSVNGASSSVVKNRRSLEIIPTGPNSSIQNIPAVVQSNKPDFCDGRTSAGKSSYDSMTVPNTFNNYEPLRHKTDNRPYPYSSKSLTADNDNSSNLTVNSVPKSENFDFSNKSISSILGSKNMRKPVSRVNHMGSSTDRGIQHLQNSKNDLYYPNQGHISHPPSDAIKAVSRNLSSAYPSSNDGAISPALLVSKSPKDSSGVQTSTDDVRVIKSINRVMPVTQELNFHDMYYPYEKVIANRSLSPMHGDAHKSKLSPTPPDLLKRDQNSEYVSLKDRFLNRAFKESSVNSTSDTQSIVSVNSQHCEPSPSPSHSVASQLKDIKFHNSPTSSPCASPASRNSSPLYQTTSRSSSPGTLSIISNKGDKLDIDSKNQNLLNTQYNLRKRRGLSTPTNERCERIPKLHKLDTEYFQNLKSKLPEVSQSNTSFSSGEIRTSPETNFVTSLRCDSERDGSPTDNSNRSQILSDSLRDSGASESDVKRNTLRLGIRNHTNNSNSPLKEALEGRNNISSSVGNEYSENLSISDISLDRGNVYKLWTDVLQRMAQSGKLNDDFCAAVKQSSLVDTTKPKSFDLDSVKKDLNSTNNNSPTVTSNRSQSI